MEQKSETENDGFKVYMNRRERRKSTKSAVPSTASFEKTQTGLRVFTRETVSNAIKAAQKTSFVGKSESSTLQVAQRYVYKWYFVSRLESTITAGDITSFLESQQEGKYVVEELTPKHDNATYKSFKIGVPFKTADAIMSPDIWPYGIFINRFYFPKNKRSDPMKSSNDAVQTDFTQNTRP